MPIPKLDRQQVLGALKSTGSSDPDVLYARKEEILADSHKLKLLGIAPIIVGGAMTLTVIGAVAGIPVLIFGIVMRRRIKNNIRVAGEVYSEYIGQLRAPDPARAATA